MTKKYEDVNFSDNELFTSVMKNKKACEIVLEIILSRNSHGIKLENVEIEKVVFNEEGKRAIRLDVYTKDGDGTVYNLEMQRVIDDFLPKRSRFYQSLLDSPTLKSGKRSNIRRFPIPISSL